MIETLYRVFKDFLNKIRKAYILRKYNDFNIAEYFRKQGAVVGENCRIMVRSLGECPFLVKIGNHCSISAGVQFQTHDGGGWIFSEEIPSLQRFGKIEVKDNCYIGANCTILRNVTIGPHSIVGADSVVTKDVPAGVVVAGNPAKYIRTIEEYKKRALAEWENQKPPNYFAEARRYSSPSAEQIQELKDRDYPLLVEHLKKLFDR